MAMFKKLFSKKPHSSPELSSNKSKLTFKKFSGSGVCDVCNRKIGPEEAYLVPNDTFYASKKYRKWIAQSGMLFGQSVDDFIAVTRSMDPTNNSAVCQDCIHLFQ